MASNAFVDPVLLTAMNDNATFRKSAHLNSMSTAPAMGLLVFAPNDRCDGISDRGIEVPPALVVEVQSPTSKTIDRVKKPRRYGDFGIPEYWVIDPVERCSWLWRFAAGAQEPERFSGRFEWRPDGAPEALALDTSELLRPLR